MHTPVQFYMAVPEDLFRLGRKTTPKLDYIRPTPPRDEKDETWDIKVYDKNGVSFVDSQSGGLSLFNYRNPKFGNLWWKIPKNTKLPSGLHISLDKGGKEGKFHFTIRPLHDMTYYSYIEKLKQLESAAMPSFLSVPKSEVS